MEESRSTLVATLVRGITIGGVGCKNFGRKRERLDKTKLRHHKVRIVDLRTRRQLGGSFQTNMKIPRG